MDSVEREELERLREWANGPNGIKWHVERTKKLSDELTALQARVEELRVAFIRVRELVNDCFIDDPELQLDALVGLDAIDDVARAALRNKPTNKES